MPCKLTYSHNNQNVKEQREIPKSQDFSNMPHSYVETFDKDHGRLEIRRHWTIPVPEWLALETVEWTGLTSLGMVERERRIGDKISKETSFYLSSMASDAKRFAAAVRNHWGVENSLHWVLDIAFREDECRVRKDHAPANLSMLRRISLNLLKQDKTIKVGVKAKRLRAGWDENYLSNLLINQVV
jgi:predicted transposase YbfD/YdcC